MGEDVISETMSEKEEILIGPTLQSKVSQQEEDEDSVTHSEAESVSGLTSLKISVAGLGEC